MSINNNCGSFSMKKFFLKIIKNLSIFQKVMVSILAVCVVGGIITTAVIASNQEIRENIGRFLRQEAVSEVIKTEEIPFEKKEEKDENKYEGETEIKQTGVPGEKSIKYKVVLNKNGEEIYSEKISEEITKEPVDEIIVVGIKQKENPAQQHSSNTPAPNSTPSQQQATNSTPSQQQATNNCNKLAGYGRPANCPTQTRAEYTSLGGWENLVRENYNSFKNYDWGNMRHTVSMSNLCYGRIYVNYDTLTVEGVSWDNQPTPTCDPVRNENPPLPSTEYLTNYLRSLAN